MRKFALAGLACVFTVGLALAADVVFLGFDKDKMELKVKDGDDTKTYKVTKDTKFKRGEKDVDNDKGVETLSKMNESEKAKGKTKLSITTDDKTVTEIKMTGGKKKDKN